MTPPLVRTFFVGLAGAVVGGGIVLGGVVLSDSYDDHRQASATSSPTFSRNDPPYAASATWAQEGDKITAFLARAGAGALNHGRKSVPSQPITVAKGDGDYVLIFTVDKSFKLNGYGFHTPDDAGFDPRPGGPTPAKLTLDPGGLTQTLSIPVHVTGNPKEYPGFYVWLS